MQYKICPHCGAKNMRESSSCSFCEESIANVQAVEATDASQADVDTEHSQDRAPFPISVEPQASQSANGPTGAKLPEKQPLARPRSSSSCQPLTEPVYAKPVQTRQVATESKSGVNATLVILFILLLCMGGYAGWYYGLKPPTPGETLGSFLAAAKAGDSEKMKQHVSQSSLPVLGNMTKEEKTLLKRLPAGAAASSGIHIEEPNFEDDSRAVVGVCSNSDILRIEFIMIKESGSWKVDLLDTRAKIAAADTPKSEGVSVDTLENNPHSGG